MRKVLAFAMLLMVLLQGIPVGGNITKFEDNSEEAIASLNAPSFDATVNLPIPADYFIANATVSVTGMSAASNASAYPEKIVVKLENDTIWTFNKTGFGPIGRQEKFSTGGKPYLSQFSLNGGTNNVSLRLPKSAFVQNTSIGMDVIPPIITNELLKMPGIFENSLFGHDCADAGDLNGDGYDDYIIGAPYVSFSPPIQDSGHAYIYFGGPGINGTPNITLTGKQIDDHFGVSVSGAGDVNKDGYDDVIVGAWAFDIIGSQTGQVYLYYGGPNMDNTSDITFTGAGPNCRLGVSVSSAGDVNNDGYDDVIVGANFDNTNGPDSGRAYIYLGGANMDNLPDIKMNGSASEDRFGCSVSNAGDLNGDGYADVIVGAMDNDDGGNSSGRAYIYFGGKNMDSDVDVILTGEEAGNWFGYSVSTARDVNKDGFDDVIVGARGNGVGAQPGWAYLFFGGNNMDNVADVTFTGESAGSDFGCSVSDAGDVNNDGWNDTLVGSEINRAYVFFSTHDTDSVPDAIFKGSGAFGEDVSDAGDMNNDGVNDILIGSFNNMTPILRTGAAFAYSINVTDIPGVLDLDVSIGADTVWKRSGYFNGTVQLAGFEKKLNDYLRAASPSGNDGYGNSYVDVPVKISAKSGGNVTLYNISIAYSYNASIPDFTVPLNNYLENHQKDKDGNGIIHVPIRVNSTSVGRLRFFGLNISRDNAPLLLKDIGTAELDEDTSDNRLVDLFQYFLDDVDPITNLSFSIVAASNESFVKTVIDAKRFVSADAATGSKNDNWTGTVEVVVACADHWGQKTESNVFTIVVKNVNDMPIITSNPDLRLEPGKPYYYNVVAIDGDHDDIEFSLLKSPRNMTIDSITGQIQWLRPSKGHFEVRVLASDGNNGTAEQIFFLDVPNTGPTITSSPPMNAYTGVGYIYNVTAEDVDNDKLAFSLETPILGMQIGSSTGTITWTPAYPGSFSATVYVSDGEVKAKQEFTINVTQLNRAPKFVSKAVTAAVAGMPYQYLSKASDYDGDTLEFSLVSGPPGMTVESANGNVSWTPKTAGNFSVVLKVVDGKGGEALQEFTIAVAEKVKAKVEILRPSENEKVKGNVVVSGTALKGTLEVVRVQVKVDGGDWVNASGTSSWEFSVDTTKMKNGPHTLQARAFDGTDYSDMVNRTFSVDNQKAAGKGFIPGFGGWALLAGTGVAGLVILWRRRRA